MTVMCRVGRKTLLTHSLELLKFVTRPPKCLPFPKKSYTIIVQARYPSVTISVMLRHLWLFGHIVRSDSDEDHSRALNAGTDDPPKASNMASVENDLKQQNLGLWSARHRAYDRDHPDQWREIVEAAMLLQGHAT